MDVGLDYTNCMAGIIGSENGTTDESFAESAAVLADCLRSLEAKKEAQGPFYYETGRMNEIKDILDFADESLPDVEDIVVAGPAGASLGSRVLHAALCYPPAMEGKRIPRIHFLDSVDPDAFAAVMYEVHDLHSTQFHLIGNSGDPPQEVALCTAIHQTLHKEHVNPKRQLVILAPPDSLLWKQAKQEGCRTFATPKHAGGLRNILTPACFLWAAFAEIDIVHLLEGARRMGDRCRSLDVSGNPAAVLAHLWNHPERFVELVTRNTHLRPLAEWFENRMGPQRGSAKSSLTMFVRVDRPRSDLKLTGDVFAESTILSGKTLHELIVEAQSTAAASLASNGKASLLLRIDRIKERSFGALLCLLESAMDLNAEFRDVTGAASKAEPFTLADPITPPKGKYVL